MLAAQFSKILPAQAAPRLEDGSLLYHLFANVVKKKVVEERRFYALPTKQNGCVWPRGDPLESPAPTGRTRLAQVRKPWESLVQQLTSPVGGGTCGSLRSLSGRR